MFNKVITFFCALILLSSLSAQDCDLNITGFVRDKDTYEPLEFVNIYIEEVRVGASTSADGKFSFHGLCQGDYHVVISHVGCETQKVLIGLRADTSVILELAHFAHELQSAVIIETRKKRSTQSSTILSQLEITDNIEDNIGNLLDGITGVNVLRNGSSISKPVVHGMYGNRVTILNNGVSQSGQQWGNDHSPEIDPLVANRISVIKGTSSLEYMGANLGAVISIEPTKIPLEPHLHGRLAYLFETNGRGHGVNLQIQKYSPILALRANATYKKNGDRHSPSYFLTNTGATELNGAIQLEKKLSEVTFIDVYASTFNTELGVLRGSHIGNLTDLQSAFSRDVPFYTADQFSYKIEAPRQLVAHNFLKTHVKHFVSDSVSLDFTIAAQLNDRKEFDIRRSGRTDIPALSILQKNLFLETKYLQEYGAWIIKTGVQYSLTDNTNNPETGILPLIPDYLSHEFGIYGVFVRRFNHSFLDIGLRYDSNLQNVASISQSLPRKIIRYSNNYNRVGSSLGYSYSFSELQTATLSIGYATRNPAINELYSAGLHQGVSGIEEGDPDLEVEKSTKIALSYDASINRRISFQTLVYGQWVDNFIFLSPQDEIRLTIRGAFPVFKYEQTYSQILGADISARIDLTKSFELELAGSFIKAQDLEKRQALVNFPSNKIDASLGYKRQKPIKIGTLKFENFETSLTNRYVFQQVQEISEQDFTDVPSSYYLLGAVLSSDLQTDHLRWRLSFKVNNLLNAKYRDYLNRQRYFSDDLGRNFMFSVGLKF